MLVPIAPHDLSNRPIVLPDTGEIRIEIVAGRDASVNFDMQSLASLLHGDRVARAPLGAPGALPAPARLELLRHAAPQAALERRRCRRARRLATAMLRRLALRDFVIVAELEVELDAGFTVLTGETGAGKSILVDALQLALGSRGDAGVVREGAARAEISAEFDTPAERWRPGSTRPASTPATTTLLLRRTIDAQGKSRAWINGSPATVAQLREAADHLVDIHGQHAWQSLTRAAAVRALLDALCRRRHRAAGRRLGRLEARRSDALRRARAQPGRPASANASAWPGRSARSTSSRPATASGTSSTPSTSGWPTRRR